MGGNVMEARGGGARKCRGKNTLEQKEKGGVPCARRVGVLIKRSRPESPANRKNGMEHKGGGKRVTVRREVKTDRPLHLIKTPCGESN